jgi:hypothetical protein
MDRVPPHRAWLAAASGGAVLAAALLGACDSGPQRGTAEFCEQLGQQLASLEGPLATQADVDELLARYQELGRFAPLAIEPSWGTLVALVETAATVDPDDADSVQRAVDAAYASERAAREVAEWADVNCGLDLPDVGGVGTPATTTTTSTTTTTAPPTSSPASSPTPTSATSDPAG